MQKSTLDVSSRGFPQARLQSANFDFGLFTAVSARIWWQNRTNNLGTQPVCNSSAVVVVTAAPVHRAMSG